MNQNVKKAPTPKMHIVEIFGRDGQLIASFPVRETGKLQARNVVLENKVEVRRASEDEISDIAVNRIPVLGIPRTAIDTGQGDLIGDGVTGQS